MATKKIVLLPVTNRYAGHGADAPQVPDKLHIPNVPEVAGAELAKALGVSKAMGKQKPSEQSAFKK